MSTEKGADAPSVDATIIDSTKTKDAVWLENELKKVIGQRDEHKQKNREYEEKFKTLEQKDIEARQAYKEKLEQIEPEYLKLKSFKTSYDERMEKALEEAESALPKDATNEYELIKAHLPNEAKLNWITVKMASSKVEPKDSPASTKPGANGAPNATALSSMSFEQRLAMKRDNPAAFKRLVGTQ